MTCRNSGQTRLARRRSAGPLPRTSVALPNATSGGNLKPCRLQNQLACTLRLSLLPADRQKPVQLEP